VALLRGLRPPGPRREPADIDWLTDKPLTYDIDHSDDLIFLDAAGRERFVVDGSPDTQGRQPPKKLAAFLGPQGRRNLDHPSQALDWTVGQAMTVFSWLTDRHLPTPG
jgi:protein SCO1/2